MRQVKARPGLLREAQVTVYPYHLGLCRHTAKTQERGVISLVHLPALGEALLFAVGHDERPHRARVFHGPAHYLGVDHGVAVVAEPHYMSPAGSHLAHRREGLAPSPLCYGTVGKDHAESLVLPPKKTYSATEELSIAGSVFGIQKT